MRENKENSEKIKGLYKELVEIKDLIHESKNAVDKSETNEALKVKKNQKKKVRKPQNSG